MDEVQYLIQCDNPTSWSIIYQRSILVELCFEKLSKGVEVTFLWPEDSPNAKPFKGRIIEMSMDETALIKTMDELKKDYEREFKKPKNKSAIKSDTKSQNVKPKKKIQRDQLACSQILEELNITKPSTSTCSTNDVDSSNTWLIEKMKTLRLDLDSCHAGLIAEVEKVKSMSSTVEKIENFLMPVYSQQGYLFENDSADNVKVLKNGKPYDIVGKIEQVVIEKDLKNRRSFNMPQDAKEDGFGVDSENLEELPTILKEESDIRRRSFNMNYNETVTLSDDDDVDLKGLHLIDKLKKSEGRKRSIYVLESSDEDDTPMLVDAIKLESEHKAKNIESKKNAWKRIKQFDEELNTDDDHNVPEPVPVKVVKNFEEYDEDGVWTLLFTEANEEKGVIELLKGSGIFIKSYVLKNIQETQVKQTCFARALANGIFTKKALSSCSLKGKVSHSKKKEDGTSSEDVRPGLHEEAVNVIITYTMSWAKQQGWKIMDIQTIKQSLRQMMIEKKDLSVLKK